MSKSLPLPVRDRSTGRVFQEFMDDSESEPRRLLMQQMQSHPAVDWLIAAYQDTRFSARVEIGPLSVGRVVWQHEPDRPFRRGQTNQCFGPAVLRSCCSANAVAGARNAICWRTRRTGWRGSSGWARRSPSALEHDPEQWKPVSRRQTPKAFVAEIMLNQKR